MTDDYRPEENRPNDFGYYQPNPVQPPPVQTVQKTRRGPGWPALIVACLIASLLGGVLGVGVMNVRWGNARPAAAPISTQSGTTETVESTGTAPDWNAVATAVGHSVVAIDVKTAEGASTGSGFVIDQQGHIMTNDHVVSGAQEVYVTLHDGRVYEAEIVGTDESTDLAVLKLKSPPEDLTVAQFGDSSKVAVGDPVTAIGNPLGLSSTMTTGIVSALDRPVQTVKEGGIDRDPTRVITNAIQIDAAVNPGNSGGPVFDAKGHVIGVASSIASLKQSEGKAGSIGLGFAIPANLAQRVAAQLIEKGVAEHAYLGVSIVDGIGQAQGTNWKGAQVRHVEPGTPAEAAGLKENDVVLQVNGRDVSSALALTGYVRQFASGDVVTLLLVRNGELLNVDVTLATRPD
ncbi:S1C family serine protease [Trueperella bialowiezensis]|uniref:Serine protease HtrA n=1 Tax=Trueperella bialowiezensis TaxID=312285 RepID=A0A3S4X6G5_9ACTO|nr:trypsin-like peptidase domain-containing protein [Trueperella bialowiezensis]VEI13694.1 Putative serine protease HtrA [Trueperella bialowiezensis]